MHFERMADEYATRTLVSSGSAFRDRLSDIEAGREGDGGPAARAADECGGVVTEHYQSVLHPPTRLDGSRTSAGDLHDVLGWLVALSRGVGLSICPGEEHTARSGRPAGRTTDRGFPADGKVRVEGVIPDEVDGR